MTLVLAAVIAAAVLPSDGLSVTIFLSLAVAQGVMSGTLYLDVPNDLTAAQLNKRHQHVAQSMPLLPPENWRQMANTPHHQSFSPSPTRKLTMDQFAGGVAVITGGASGLGKQFARQCADLGMRIMLADVQQDALDATLAELRATYPQLAANIHGLRVDVADVAQVQALAAHTKATFGSVNLVFNNAGVGSGGLV
mgnify:CR=1 FL=1